MHMICLCLGEELPFRLLAQYQGHSERIANLVHLSHVASEHMAAMLERTSEYAYTKPFNLLYRCETPLPTVYSDADTNSELLLCVKGQEVPEPHYQPAHMRSTSLHVTMHRLGLLQV